MKGPTIKVKLTSDSYQKWIKWQKNLGELLMRAEQERETGFLLIINVKKNYGYATVLGCDGALLAAKGISPGQVAPPCFSQRSPLANWPERIRIGTRNMSNIPQSMTHKIMARASGREQVATGDHARAASPTLAPFPPVLLEAGLAVQALQVGADGVLDGAELRSDGSTVGRAHRSGRRPAS